jgi:ketosteroid isomerase-like protein
MDESFDAFLEARRAAGVQYLRGNGEPAAALSAQSGPSTFFDPTGGLIEGAKAIIAEKLQGATRFGPASNDAWLPKDQGESGDLGYWVGYQQIEADLNGTIQPLSVRVTEIYRKIDGAWKIVHRHASKAGGPPV